MPLSRRFEFGAILIQDDLTLIERETATAQGTLRIVSAHEIDTEQLVYHRERFNLSP